MERVGGRERNNDCGGPIRTKGGKLSNGREGEGMKSRVQKPIITKICIGKKGCRKTDINSN